MSLPKKLLNMFRADEKDRKKEVIIEHRMNLMLERQEFIIIGVLSEYRLRVECGNQILTLDISGRRVFQHRLSSFIQKHNITDADVNEGRVKIHVLGSSQDEVRGRRYDWQFTKL